MSLFPPPGPGARAARRAALAGCLTLGAIGGIIACVQEPAQETREPVEPAREAAAERPTWYPSAPPPPPESCGVGCVKGRGNAVVRFQMDGGDYTASFSIEGNEGPFLIGPPIDISNNTETWSGIRTFFNPEAGVHAIRIRATGEWTLDISKGRQTYVDGQ